MNENQAPYSISPYNHTETPCPDLDNMGKPTERQLKGQITALTTELKTEKRRSEGLEVKMKDLVVEKENGFKDREEQIASLHREIENLKSKRSSKFGRKIDQKKDVNKTVDKYVKAVLFRNTKFAQPGENSLDDSELRTATEKVWHGIKARQRLDRGPEKLTMEDFIEIYESQVLKSLSDCRQYVQSRTGVCIKRK